MQILPVPGGALVCFFLYLFIVGFSNAGGKTLEVVGVGECADCAENNLETSQAFSGLRVNIDCKPENGKYFKTRGSGELDKHGNFKVSLPEEMVKDGELKEECYAQLHSVSAEPCPSHDGMESVKIVLKSSSDEKHNFGLKGKLRFSPVTCASATFWHHPPLPKWNHPPLPTFPIPPLKWFHHHHPIFSPIYKKPLPPSVPVSKPPPVPVYEKPLPPPVPKYKKPHPPPVPIYKKPHPPPVPAYKPPVNKSPPVPIYKKPHPPPVPVYNKPLPPPVPVYKKPPTPIYTKPHPPIPKIPPLHKKPCPPLPKLPPLPKIPPKYFHHHPLPKLPPFPKYFHHHPKFGKWPPLPPFSHHHP
ncbi:proline-rich protein 4-like [Hibiscus syriacus]|uniref:proline-rich protein 4-like n=1 Tax=Hibiscus syriacus TaxID=106335 RepID=UPI0019228AA1|nr:proline-rich protein 4-like [Hibiscus syriacus]